MTGAKKKHKAGQLCGPEKRQFLLSPAEQAVLSVFRKYLMTPGKMLCFSGSNLEALSAPLAQLIDKGLLFAERYRGGYSLTEQGFAAMKDAE